MSAVPICVQIEIVDGNLANLRFFYLETPCFRCNSHDAQPEDAINENMMYALEHDAADFVDLFLRRGAVPWQVWFSHSVVGA